MLVKEDTDEIHPWYLPAAKSSVFCGPIDKLLARRGRLGLKGFGGPRRYVFLQYLLYSLSQPSHADCSPETDSVSDLNQHLANADESNQLPAGSSPVTQLPSETLITIFLECVAHDTPSSSNLGWIQITHVCRFWRVLALHSPLLWTNIPLRLGRECMEEFIRRSNSAPLKLYHATGPNVLPLSEVPIESIRHRVYSISIGYTTHAQERAHKFIDDLLQSAPSLEEIRIAGMREPGNEFGIVIDSTLGFDSPRHFFTRSVPLLRKLSLHSISPIPWSAFPFHNLTRLEISSQLWDLPRDGTEDHTIISSLLDLLKTTPDLETLELCNSLPKDRKKNSQIIPHSPRPYSSPLRHAGKTVLNEGDAGKDCIP